MKISLISSHLMSQIIYKKNVDFKNSFHFLPFNTYPEYNKACITYTFFPLKIFPYLSPHSISASFVLHISKRTLHFHVASPFATPFEPSRSFYFVRLYRSFPPFEAMGASSGVRAIIPSGWNSIGTTEMAQGSWPMA